MTATLVIVGRPNVGKSTLFNRLVGGRQAVVDASPGVTRDWREGDGRLGDLQFRVIDTAGVTEQAPRGSLEARMRRQTERAIETATLALFVIDARDGVTPDDQAFAAWLRTTGLPVVLVANKCESRAGEAGRIEAYALGFGDPIPISAEHGEGLALLYEAVQPYLEDKAGPEEETERPLRLAIVGRPNVGKSTLVNALLGEERVLTGPEPGITRDAIAARFRHGDQEIELVDTAGLRRRAKVEERVEALAAADTLRVVRFAHVVAVVLDAVEGIDRQDLNIARQTVEEGRALVVVGNKWDAVTERGKVATDIRERIGEAFPLAARRIVLLSARTGENLDELLPAVLSAHAAWNRRIATPELNDWLADATMRHPPPLDSRHRRIKLRYITQARTRPPTFALFGNMPAELPTSYLRYLENSLRGAFALDGTPLRFLLRRGRNPYAESD